MNKYLSIIIPMYNCEKYIAACLNSILQSDLPSDMYEILIIDDGSTDRGPEIVQEYINRSKNLRYFSQENQGQSVARNLGIKECIGEYIWFVDGDDMVEVNIKHIFDELSHHKDLDIYGIQLKLVEEDLTFIETCITQPSVKHRTILSGREAVIQGYNPSSVCALITKRQYLLNQDFQFVPGITHQDVELSYRMMAYANKVYFSDYSPYIYIRHLGSTSKATILEKKIKYICDDIYIIKSFRILSDNIRNDIQLSKTIEARANNVLFGMVYSLFCNKIKNESQGINSIVINRLKEEKLYPINESYNSTKKECMRLLLNIEWLIK